jgi:hypothetical protein
MCTAVGGRGHRWIIREECSRRITITAISVAQDKLGRDSRKVPCSPRNQIPIESITYVCVVAV